MSRPTPVSTLFIPSICSLEGTYTLVASDSPSLEVLHHETGEEAEQYPLQLEDNTFFSEVFAADFPEVAEYRELILGTLGLIKSEIDVAGSLPYDRIDTVGKRIQALDAEFARGRIGRELDAVHTQWGPNAEHPYRKVTLCRTTLPVRMEDQIARFFYEKYLVVYSYLDDKGIRRSTITPIHSHPYNHEVVYFAKHGLGSRAIEQEYAPTDKSGAPLFSESGELNPNLISADERLTLPNLKARFERESVLEGTDEPILLEPFESEALSRNPSFIFQTDGLFRPHKVTICDSDTDGGTFYYAFNNYWGPLARVIVYDNSGDPVLWNHKEWAQ